MALVTTLYRIKIDMNYTTTTTASNAASALNTALSNAGRAETVTLNGVNVYLMIHSLSESEALSLRTALQSAWSGQARSGGKVSMVRTDATN